MTAGLVAPAAVAYPDDPYVVLSGGAGCKQLLFLPSHVTFHLDNGETASSGFSLSSYKVKFFDIAAIGTSGVATVTCSRGGQSYSFDRALTVYRPAVGNNSGLSLGGG
jgi:hypothetical protein